MARAMGHYIKSILCNIWRPKVWRLLAPNWCSLLALRLYSKVRNRLLYILEKFCRSTSQYVAVMYSRVFELIMVSTLSLKGVAYLRNVQYMWHIILHHPHIMFKAPDIEQEMAIFCRISLDYTDYTESLAISMMQVW